MQPATPVRETIASKDGRIEVQTELTDNEASAVLQALSNNKFANTLCAKRSRYGKWTQNQRAWAHNLAMEAKYPERRQQQPEAIKLGDFSRLAEMFSLAGQRLKYPKIVFEFEDQPIVLYRAGAKSKYNGQIQVTDGGRYRQGKYFGRIDESGRLHPSGQCTDEVAAFLRLFAANPAGFAATYGKESGSCCFCRQQLTDKRSLAVGMGPVCAKNYGLEQAWKEAIGERRRGRGEDST